LKKMPEVPLSFLETDQEFRKFSGFTGTHIGSNNWAVNGKKSVTGKPIIANDPHLALQSPGFWYAAVLRGKTIRAEGFTVPGVPGVVIGKNQNISWVVTNAMLDDTDFYLEQIDSTGKKYLVDGQWNSIKSTKYRITVKDSDNVELNVRETHRGPIVSGVHQLNRNYPSADLKIPQVSMRWTGNEFTDELTAILKVNNASNWTEFKEGIKLFSVPAQNFVYADKEGNIGYYCAGRLPVRETNSPTFVFNGTSSANDWKGYVPFESMPSVFNPAENYIASANNKTVKDFPYHLSNLWEPPSRIERIHELLGGKEKHSVKDFQHYQNDFISPYARELTGYITGAFENIKIKDPNLKAALDLLKGWNHELNDLSQVPTIEEVFFQFLLKNTFEDEMGKNLFGQYVFMANVPYRTMIKLLRENKSPWFDNTRTPQVEGRDEIIRKSLVDALDYIEKNLSSDLQEWQWGKLHTVTLKHMFSGKSGLVDNYINIGPYSVGGSGTTLFNTEYSFDNPYETILGPSMRYIFDFSRPDEFYIILTSGQSGNVFSPHYKDMTEMWLTGKYIKISTDENVIRNSGFDLTILR
ncbi:MAG: penicillin acylase family protein, partial [Syntrophothermus sp.]